MAKKPSHATVYLKKCQNESEVATVVSDIHSFLDTSILSTMV